MTNHCQNNEEAMEENLAVCLNHTSSVQHSVSDFAINVIKAGEDPAPVEDRNVLSFREELSSTPADHIILRELKNDAAATSSEDVLDHPVHEEENASSSTPNQKDTTCFETTSLSSMPVLQELTNAENCPSAPEEGPGDMNKRRAVGGTEPTQNASRSKRVRTKR